jgi:hypothetical protein
MLSLEMTLLRFHRPGATRRPTLLGRAVAWLAVGLVGLLSWLAADAEAHEFFHPDAAGHSTCAHGHAGCTHGLPADSEKSTAHDEHQCIVTAFAAGATDVALVACFFFAGLRLTSRLAPAADSIARPEPGVRHAPSCGPPGRA